MQTIKILGRTFVSHDCWTWGDYGGAGSLGLANIILPEFASIMSQI